MKTTMTGALTSCWVDYTSTPQLPITRSLRRCPMMMRWTQARNRTEELPSQMPLVRSLLAKPHHRRGQQCPSGSARTTPTHTSDLQMRFTKIHQSGRRAMTETHLLMAPHLPILQQTTNSSHYQRTSTILAILFGFHISLFTVSCVLLV